MDKTDHFPGSLHACEKDGASMWRLLLPSQIQDLTCGLVGREPTGKPLGRPYLGPRLRGPMTFTARLWLLVPNI